MSLGKSYNLLIGDKTIKIEPTLKILGVILDRDLPFIIPSFLHLG